MSGALTSAAESARFDPARVPDSDARHLWRSFVTAARLGWLMEANWTDPVLFFIYSVAKPLASTFILVFMLEVIGGAAGRDFRGFVVVGSALWAFVISGISGLAMSILDDRERYRMLKYLYVSPSDFMIVLLGRGVARIGVGAMGAAITLVVGVAVLGVRFDPGRIDWPLLVIVMVGGLATIVAFGVVMAAICLQTRQESWSYPEAAAGALFLVVGAVFPLSVLPTPAQVLGLLTPLTWWLAGVRQALFPAGQTSVGGPGSLFEQLFGHDQPTSVEIVLALLATGALVTLASSVIFRVSDRRAKEQGLIDRTTGT
jgi:ABC-2 type transport system permease protein